MASPKKLGCFLGVPTIRIMASGDLDWGPHISRNYHLISFACSTPQHHHQWEEQKEEKEEQSRNVEYVVSVVVTSSHDQQY